MPVYGNKSIYNIPHIVLVKYVQSIQGSSSATTYICTCIVQNAIYMDTVVTLCVMKKPTESGKHLCQQILQEGLNSNIHIKRSMCVDYLCASSGSFSSDNIQKIYILKLQCRGFSPIVSVQLQLTHIRMLL